MKIAIVKLSALGDIVHAMVVLQFIKQSIPDCSIDWIVEVCFKEVLENNPHIDNILPVNLKAIKKDKKQLFSQIALVKIYAKNNYDLVIDLQGLVKSAIVSKILGSNVGFDKNSIREKIAAFFYKQSFYVPYEENVILRNLKLTSLSLGLEVKKEQIDNKQDFLFFNAEDENISKDFLKDDKKNIIYILGSSWESKIYPKEKFVEIIKALNGNHLLVWGNKTEEKSAQYIQMHTNARKLPKLNLNELKAVISKADLVIGGDSGPIHFAWALNRPSITVFGPTPSERNTLTTSINKIVDTGNTIDPLDLNKNDFSIQSIDPKKIIELARDLL